jgi:aryl-alcohol dehydrogenase-like predicted oxidoreductase
MRYRDLGRTGIKVSPYGLGALMFATQMGNEPQESARIVHKALDAGINLIDTSDAYADSEEVLAQALKGRRDEVVLATKFGLPAHGGTADPNRRGASRRWITTAVEQSLRRLETDHIDLYQLQRPDPETDIEETLGALTDLVRAGKIRAFGTSTMPASDLVEAHAVACTGSAPSSRRTRSSTAASNAKCCPWPSGTAWASSSGVRSDRAC